MIHLIAFARISGKQYAYDYCVKDSDYTKIISKKKELINTSSNDAKLLYTIHVIQNSAKDFNQIKKADSYFTHTIEYKSFDEFLSAINSDAKLTARDTASYLLRNYPQLNHHRFAFHKVLYYIYADYLVDNHFSLFNANFVAYDKGPVDYNIYRMEKYQKDSLIRDTSFELKLQLMPDRRKILNLISTDINKYVPYFDQIWNKYQSSDSKYNLTHRVGTPWSIAYKKGRNSAILDSDIVKYHKLETI